MRYCRTRVITFAKQNHNIRTDFPLFECNVNTEVWYGKLQPTENSVDYDIEVQFNKGWPKVFINSPNIDDRTPHLYSDSSLCLYYPADRTYNKTMLISRTVLPWAAEWLYFYEAWKKEGIWWADEAPHSPRSNKNKSRDSRRKRRK